MDQKPLVSLFTRPRRFGNAVISIVLIKANIQLYFLLLKMLAAHYDKASIIIDEYDTPIQEGYAKDFYDEIIGFMRNFFSGAFKDNRNLSYGFLTGILRIAQESIFSGLNNLTVNSVMDEEYDSFLGFTSDEVKEMLEYYGMPDKESELKDWYDGYLFGAEEIYNPWSVINYISKGGIPQAYWVNTGKNEILEDVLKTATDDITERLYSLLQGERVIARIDQNVVYRSLAEDPANIYSLLLVAGYLKTPKKELQAVEQFKSSPADTYDAILMDVMMPVMDGITAEKEIRAVNRSDAKQIPIIAMTANAFKEDAQKCFEAGMNAHLAKPLNVKMLKQTIEELTGKCEHWGPDEFRNSII